jgi:tRNA threonylcarbamoyladenosine biosynthesis protein TsaB
MLVLALDTTTRAGSVALLDDERVVDERAGDGTRTHAERLPAEITALLDAHHLTLADVGLYAVASGPGSFTGLRIGIATIQGLALVHARRIAAISALDALGHLAAAGSAPGTLVGAWMDAHRREVFAALYRVHLSTQRGAGPSTPLGASAAAGCRAAHLEELEGPTVGDPPATLARWAVQVPLSQAVFVGDGATLYADAIARAAPDARIAPPVLLAAAIGRLAVVRQSASIEPGAMRPLYVRRPDAEIARDEKLRVVEIDHEAH